MNEQPKFKTWEELTEAEQLACVISDDYKSLMGFRPRPDWSKFTVEELRAWHKQICEDIRREMEYERQEELAHEKAVAQAMDHKSGFTIGELVSL